VEEFSRYIGDAEGNSDYLVSNTYLSELETGKSTPSIYKLYSLSVIYGIKFTDILMFYGVDLEKISKFRADLPLPFTRLTDLTVYDRERKIAFPIRLDAGFKLTMTQLLPQIVETWGEIPVALIQHYNLRKSLFGYIGLADRNMYPILRPGSFVRIDSSCTSVQDIPWKTELERPIYFVLLRNSYTCSWCEIHGKQLVLIPHPQSGCKLRQFPYPDEAEILGRVTAVAMSLVDSGGSAPADSARGRAPS
jgi:transcriptional regulator with XRE-family HTH domain